MTPNEEKRDIFDRLMVLPVLRLFEPFYRKHKEVLLYLFFGVLTTLISWGVFYLFHYPFGVNELAANILSWVMAVLFAFLTNRAFVFSLAAKGNFFFQMLRFFASRLTTLGVEEVILFVFVTTLQYDAMLIKILGNVLVLILNYVFSKIFVFRKTQK